MRAARPMGVFTIDSVLLANRDANLSSELAAGGQVLVMGWNGRRMAVSRRSPPGVPGYGGLS